jgi:nucleoside-diphosphate-sugar epimerase
LEVLAKPRLLVIGGTGFIGHHLLVATKDDWCVTSISLNPPSAERFVDSVRYLHLDLTDLHAVKNVLVEEYEYVVNLGGYINHTLFKDGGRILIDAHFHGLQNLISTLSRNSLKRFVQIGSSDEYGNSPAPQQEDMRELPISPYSLAKVASTHFLQMLNRTEGLPAVVLRLFLVYGPGQDEQRFLPQVVRACLRDEDFPVSEAKQLRDFCHINDIVRAIILALRSKNVEGYVINIASGVPVTIREMIESVQKIIGSGRPRYGAVAYRSGENLALYANISRARDVLGWTPEVGIDQGLESVISYLADKYDGNATS